MDATDFPRLAAYLEGNGDLEAAVQELTASHLDFNALWVEPPPDAPADERARVTALHQRFVEVVVERDVRRRTCERLGT